MSVRLTRAVVPAKPDEGRLNPGDTIEIGITAEMKVDRDDVWVKYAVQSVVGENESGEEAHVRVSNFSKSHFRKTVYEVVDLVQTMGE